LREKALPKREDSLALLRAAASNRVHVPVPGLKVEITDLETNVVTSYDSVRKAADALDSDIKTLLRLAGEPVLTQVRTSPNSPYL